MRKYESAGCAVGEILLPKPGVDLQKWAVVACDQFTSQPEYWKSVSDFVGSEPSTLKMIFPEVFLGEPNSDQRITAIRATMQQYLDEGILVPHDGLIYIERFASGKVRRGLVLCLDLEQYDYNKGSGSLIRATEGTILDRLPPRIKIREDAPVELPHIMVLIDDPENTVIGPLSEKKNSFNTLYDIDLMMNSGHLTGYHIEDRDVERSVMDSLARLGDREKFQKKYGLGDTETPVLLYAMGDGNHSLATAKAIWERIKEQAEDVKEVMQSAARYALIELVNVYDESLEFEPIHRVIFETQGDIIEKLKSFFGDRLEVSEVDSGQAMQTAVDHVEEGLHKIGLIREKRFEILTISNPDSNLAVGTIQTFVDGWLKDGGAREVDYVHGTDTVIELGSQPGNVGLYLPSMSKHDLFKSVIFDGALPRKTFSMGEAEDKRFYFECRRIN